MSDCPPPPYTIVVAEPFGPHGFSPNFSSVSPPRPQDMVCPSNMQHSTFWVLRFARVVGIVGTWAQASDATQGVPGYVMVPIHGWDAAISTYNEALTARSVRIYRPPDLQGQPQFPILVPSSPSPDAVGSTFATPARLGDRQNPLSVDSSPAPVSPSPARNGSRYNPMTVHSSPALAPASVNSSPAPVSPSPARNGSRYNPMTIQSSPAPAPAVIHTTPAVGSRPDHVSVQSSPIAPVGKEGPHTPAFSSWSDDSTPTPITPRHKGKETASQTRLRAIEDALEHYAARNNVDIPLPVTPTSNPDNEARIAAIEDCLNDLLTREAQRVSAREARRNTPAICDNPQLRAKLTAQFEHAMLQFLEHSSSDGWDPTPSQGSAVGLPVAQQNGDDQTSASSLSGSLTGPGATPATAPVAGSSTGPGTAAAAVPESSQEINYFAGFEDENYTDAELALLEKLLNGETV